MGWIAYQFPVVHSYETVAMGDTVTVYELSIPAGGVGFIYDVANNYFYGVEWDWLIDDARVEPNKITRQLGLVNQPKHYDPPLLVKNNIKFIAYNGSIEDVELEVLCQGYIYVKSD